MTVPKSVGQIPFNFPSKPNAQVDGGAKLGLKGNMSRVNGALYHFGYGLSYTTFEYSDLNISPKTTTDKQNITVSFKISNTGDKDGDEVVQLYTRDLVSSVTTYEKNLRGFDRVHLKAGETKNVKFIIKPDDLSLLNIHNEWVVEPGEFKIMIGASSEDIRLEDTLLVRDIFDRTSKIEVRNKPDSTLNKVLDNNKETVWNAKSGDSLTFALEEGTKAHKISILWKDADDSATFEIQASRGGGQFITTYAGKVQPTDNFQEFPLGGDVASDIRILLTEGKASISEVILDNIKK